MSFKKLFHVDQDDTVAVPEYHSENFDELQKKADEEENNELKRKDIASIPPTRCRKASS